MGHPNQQAARTPLLKRLVANAPRHLGKLGYSRWSLSHFNFERLRPVLSGRASREGSRLTRTAFRPNLSMALVRTSFSNICRAKYPRFDSECGNVVATA